MFITSTTTTTTAMLEDEDLGICSTTENGSLTTTKMIQIVLLF